MTCNFSLGAPLLEQLSLRVDGLEQAVVGLPSQTIEPCLRALSSCTVNSIGLLTAQITTILMDSEAKLGNRISHLEAFVESSRLKLASAPPSTLLEEVVAVAGTPQKLPDLDTELTEATEISDMEEADFSDMARYGNNVLLCMCLVSNNIEKLVWGAPPDPCVYSFFRKGQETVSLQVLDGASGFVIREGLLHELR
jgi:hypothetical protein